MSWSLKKKSQALLADEQGTVIKDWGGKISVALVYPNTYAVGMSNLGFQTIYRHLNAIPDVVCERVFMPEPADLAEMRRASMAPRSRGSTASTCPSGTRSVTERTERSRRSPRATARPRSSPSDVSAT